MSYTILRLPAVKIRTGLSKSSIYAKLKNGDFPSPIPLGERAVGWVEAEIDDWLQNQIERSRAE